MVIAILPPLNCWAGEKIAEFLLTTVKSVRQDRPNPEYIVRTTSLKANLTLCNYL